MQTARPSRVRRPTYEIPRAQPAHHFVRREGTAHITLYAEAFDTLQPVRGGVLDAPPLRDCRGVLDASVRPDLFCPRHLRCVRLASTTQRIQSRGHSPRTIFTGAPTFSVNPRREGVEALPYGGWGRYPHLTHVALNPSVTALRAATAPLSGEPRGGVRRSHVILHPRPGGRGSPPLRGIRFSPTSPAAPQSRRRRLVSA